MRQKIQQNIVVKHAFFSIKIKQTRTIFTKLHTINAHNTSQLKINRFQDFLRGRRGGGLHHRANWYSTNAETNRMLDTVENNQYLTMNADNAFVVMIIFEYNKQCKILFLTNILLQCRTRDSYIGRYLLALITFVQWV